MKLQPALPGPRYDALIKLLQAAEALWNASRVFFGRWDLSPSQFNVLNLLSDAPEGLSQIDLSRQLVTHRSNVTGLVDRLEQRGLLKRRDDSADRRAYRVMLTEAGQRLLSEIRPVYYKTAEQVWGNTPVSHAKQVAHDLANICHHAERVAKANQ
jgi:DNA-binding MarR family transcriptional regulator